MWVRRAAISALIGSYGTAACSPLVILKAREPAGIMTATGNKKENKWHLETKLRWVDQYNFYLNDARWGPMFVRVCPYFPFSARICLNQHNWLAQRLEEAKIGFEQT